MSSNRGISFVGNHITSENVVYSKFSHKQRYHMSTIVEKLNYALVNNNKLHIVKRPYIQLDVITMVEELVENNNCDYDEAIKILNKQLKEKNFDIYKP